MAIFQICGVVILAALVQAQSDGCYDAMKCVTVMATKALFAKNRTEICRLAPGIIECAERENAQCDDETMSNANARGIREFKESAKNCPIVTTTQMTTLTVKKCAEQFTSCYTSEFQRNSEQNKEERVCNELPMVIECLEKTLSLCQRTEGQQVEKMSAELEKIRKQFANSKCAASASEDRSKYDSAAFLVTSIMQTCIALILAILLH